MGQWFTPVSPPPRMSCSNRIISPLQKDQHNRACYFSWQVLHIRSKKLLRTVRFRSKTEADKRHINELSFKRLLINIWKLVLIKEKLKGWHQTKCSLIFQQHDTMPLSVRETSLILPRKGQSPSGQLSLLIILLTQKYTWKYIFLSSF